MRVVLISDNKQLEQACRRILSGFDFASLRVCRSALSDECRSAAVVIIDYRPDCEIRGAAFSPQAQLIILTGRCDLAHAREANIAESARVLLKPANDAMLQTYLEHAFAQYHSMSATSDGPGSERDPLFDMLVNANLRLQEFDQKRTDLLARTMHDCRVPLTALQGYCRLLINQTIGPLTADQTEVVRGMERTAKRLSMLANTLLDLAMGGLDRVRPGSQEVCVESCVRQAVSEIVPLASDKHVQVHFKTQPPAGTVRFNPSQLEQVLVNLMENACKFTPRFGSIEVLGYPVRWDGTASFESLNGLRPQPGNAANAYRVDVKDSGRGIMAEHSGEIFNEYSCHGDGSGSGLGLSICRMILESNNGRIWVNSSEKGAVFSFVVPCCSRASASSPFVDERFLYNTASAV